MDLDRIAPEAIPGIREDAQAWRMLGAITSDNFLAERSLDRFVSLYGAVAGDLTLVAQATGGCYIGGGIAPKILPRLRSKEFLRSFRAKGRLAPLLKQVPVRVILEPRTALLGAAHAALARLENKLQSCSLRTRNIREYIPFDVCMPFL